MAWYDTCAKPPWQPPNYAFQIVWPILYAIYAYMLFVEWDSPALTPLLIGLVMNFCWVPLFSLSTRAALVLLTGMVLVAIQTIIVLWAQDKKYGRTGLASHALLFSPYLLWISFAWTLNAYIAFTC